MFRPYHIFGEVIICNICVLRSGVNNNSYTLDGYTFLTGKQLQKF